MRSWLLRIYVATVIVAGAASVLAAKNSSRGDDLFEQCVVPDLRLEISEAGLSSLSHAPRKYVRATVREGAKVYTNVAVHLKGTAGSFRQVNDKPAFTVNFDKFAPGQTFHGLKKIHLNNSVQDRTYLHEKFSRELCNAAGVPTPRAGNAWVELNGEELGMYVLLEGVNKQFLKRYFVDVTGNMYEGHSGSEVNQRLRANCGENRSDRSRLEALAAAIRQPDLSDRQKALQQTLDLDRFYSFMAIELMLGHWDGYTEGRNNFRVYHDRDANRMVFIPHGMDQVLGRRYGIYPQNSQGATTRSVLEVPELRARYRERYGEIATNIFRAENFTNRIALAAQKITEAFARHDPALAEAYEKLGPALCRAVAKRAAYVQNLVLPASPSQFDGLGVLHPTNWVSKTDAGEATVDSIKDKAGNALLHIATEEGCTASWRTRVDLPPGEYRFQARIKTKGVVLSSADQRAGAGLRIARHRAGQKNAGDQDWTPIFFDFNVGENNADTELVCELRADEGEI